MQFLAKNIQLHESPSCDSPLRFSEMGEPVRVLAVSTEGNPPGFCCLESSNERLAWYRANSVASVQVGHPPNVGFAVVPRSLITDTPF